MSYELDALSDMNPLDIEEVENREARREAEVAARLAQRRNRQMIEAAEVLETLNDDK